MIHRLVCVQPSASTNSTPCSRVPSNSSHVRAAPSRVFGERFVDTHLSLVLHFCAHWMDDVTSVDSTVCASSFRNCLSLTGFHDNSLASLEFARFNPTNHMSHRSILTHVTTSKCCLVALRVKIIFYLMALKLLCSTKTLNSDIVQGRGVSRPGQ